MFNLSFFLYRSWKIVLVNFFLLSIMLLVNSLTATLQFFSKLPNIIFLLFQCGFQVSFGDPDSRVTGC
uniref:Uncharacterized protein n=1 Tax=Populus trichocarpa TaxID=3694 RepID=A0A2K1WWA7_POPTR